MSSPVGRTSVGIIYTRLLRGWDRRRRGSVETRTRNPLATVRALVAEVHKLAEETKWTKTIFGSIGRRPLIVLEGPWEKIAFLQVEFHLTLTKSLFRNMAAYIGSRDCKMQSVSQLSCTERTLYEVSYCASDETLRTNPKNLRDLTMRAIKVSWSRACHCFRFNVRWNVSKTAVDCHRVPESERSRLEA